MPPIPPLLGIRIYSLLMIVLGRGSLKQRPEVIGDAPQNAQNRQHSKNPSRHPPNHPVERCFVTTAKNGRGLTTTASSEDVPVCMPPPPVMSAGVMGSGGQFRPEGPASANLLDDSGRLVVGNASHTQGIKDAPLLAPGLQKPPCEFPVRLRDPAGHHDICWTAGNRSGALSKSKQKIRR